MCVCVCVRLLIAKQTASRFAVVASVLCFSCPSENLLDHPRIQRDRYSGCCEHIFVFGQPAPFFPLFSHLILLLLTPNGLRPKSKQQREEAALSTQQQHQQQRQQQQSQQQQSQQPKKVKDVNVLNLHSKVMSEEGRWRRVEEKTLISCLSYFYSLLGKSRIKYMFKVLNSLLHSVA